MTATITDLGTGQYSVSYALTAAGSWSLAVQLAGSHITSSPFAITAVAGMVALQLRAHHVVTVR